ncbi:unnamed protein product, partial [Soboliphyme baturini]|uniref:Uncharacterized protein n=1 Tax=Soboliphyme baturini TaxID=241478 RepID=A0A183ITC5_9BILA
MRNEPPISGFGKTRRRRNNRKRKNKNGGGGGISLASSSALLPSDSDGRWPVTGYGVRRGSSSAGSLSKDGRTRSCGGGSDVGRSSSSRRQGSLPLHRIPPLIDFDAEGQLKMVDAEDIVAECCGDGGDHNCGDEPRTSSAGTSPPPPPPPPRWLRADRWPSNSNDDEVRTRPSGDKRCRPDDDGRASTPRHVQRSDKIRKNKKTKGGGSGATGDEPSTSYHPRHGTKT